MALIISAGGATLPANILLARYFNTPNIFCGTIRNLPQQAFKGILVPYKQFENKPPYIVSLKPCNIAPDKKVEPRSKSSVLFLLGGDCNTHRFSKNDWDNLLSLMSEELEKPSRSSFEIIVCTSRRTPHYASDALSALSMRHPALIYHDYRITGAFNLEQELLQACFVVLTEDSNSMITEAVCSQKPLFIYQPKERKLPKLEESYIKNLEDDSRLMRIASGQNITLLSLKERTAKLQTMTVNHLDVLASKILDQIKI